MTCRVVCADSLAYMRKAHSGAFDIGVFSPPYGKSPGFLFDVRREDWAVKFEPWAFELTRVCKVWGINMTPLVDDKTKTAIPFVERLIVHLDNVGIPLFDRWMMYKTAPRPFRGNRALSGFEFILLFSASPSSVPLNEGRWLTAFKESTDRAGVARHAAHLGQRAYAECIPEALINAHCPPNGWVLDPFCGSGTTGRVAKRMGRNFVGVEIDPVVAKLAKEAL